MTKSSPVTQKILIWTYERGTLQYDIICALILAFIFFVPPRWLNKRHDVLTRSLNKPSEISQPADEDTFEDPGDFHHEKN